MTTSAVSSSGLMRISGLASGIDVDSIVQKLMTAERIPLDKLKQKQQIFEWQEQQYRDLNAKVLALKNQAFTMKLQSTYKQYTAVSSNDNVVSASATSLASQTAYTFNQITSLAQVSNIATADGSNISLKTSVATGGSVATPINTNTANTFQISYNGNAFVNVTLASGKTYDGTTPGGTLNDLVNNLQSAVDTALSAQSVAAGTVKVSLTQNGTIQFTTNNAVTGTAPTLVLQKGATNDLLAGGLGFTPDATTGQVSAVAQSIDLTQSLYANLQQGRFKNTTDFGWIVNGSFSQQLSGATNIVVAGTLTTGVGYNNTNISNYAVTTVEGQAISLGVAADNTTTTVNYNSNNVNNVSVYVNGTKYSVVNGVAQSSLTANQVSISDDGTGKTKLTFKSQLAVGTNIQVDQNTTYSVVSGVDPTTLTSGQVLLTQDATTGKAQFTFKNQMAAGTQINVDRHDFQFSTSVYNQDGSVSNSSYTINAMTETMNSLVNKINTTTNSGLTAFYDTGTDKFVLDAAQTGKNNSVGNDITVTGNFLTGALVLTKYTNGSDAAFTLNGLATTRKNNNFTINGVNFTLKGTTTTPVTVNTIEDVDKVYNSIKAFVDQYNDTIASVNTKLTEKRDYNYQPLTDDQKAAMKDSDITNWNNKAQAGLITGDTMLQGIVDNMRRGLYDKVTSASDPNFDQLTEVGITTSTIYQDKGKLIINEGTLRNAIAQNPDKVMQLFTNTSIATDQTQNYNESGLATRIYNITSDGINNISQKAGSNDAFSVYDNSFLGVKLSQTATDIYNLQQTLADKENHYYSEFTNMETALSNMNAQSSWLTAQLSSSK